MPVPAPPERNFVIFGRGEQREQLLENFRVGLRYLTNPDTGLAFTESEIAIATAVRGRFYAEAEAIDLLLLTGQNNALYLADQTDHRTSGHAWLEERHLPLWGERFLLPSGGSGAVSAPGAVGTAFIGSTTVPDPAATYGTDAAGLKYQVLFSEVVAIGQTSVALSLVGIDTGTETNLDTGDLITWSNPPVGFSGPATVTADFTGGTPAETDAEAIDRLSARIRHKPGAGNRAHFRGWARDASNAVEDAFVYAAAFHAGSTVVAITQKRGTVEGPTGRIPSVGTLTAVTGYLTPPGSGVVPAPPHVVVVPVVGTASNIVMDLSLPRGSSSGWGDLSPWPSQSAGTPATITALSSQTQFQITSLVAPGSGVDAPLMMVWDDARSRFVALGVQVVASAGGNVYNVTLTGPSAKVIAVGDYISPYAARLLTIGRTVEAYFDSLGPGEVVSLTTDSRAHRAYRFPKPSEEFPQRCGSSVLTFLRDALGASLADSDLAAVSLSTPALPTNIEDGPRLIVAGRVMISPL